MGDFITLKGVSFAYSAGAAPVLRGLSLQVGEGERIAVVGANGSGKSTMVKLINGLLVPQEGLVAVAGYDTRNRRELRQIRRMVGMVFQNPDNQLVAGTVEEEVAFGLQNYGVSTEEMKQRVQEALAFVELWDERKRPPEQLSGGQKQRVAIASALAFSPQCVIFDEATSMLDASGRESVLALQSRLKREGRTILSVTHDMGEAAQADRVVLVAHGEVALDEPPERFFAHDLAPYQLERPLVAEISARIGERFRDFPHPLLRVDDLLREWDKRRMERDVESTR